MGELWALNICTAFYKTGDVAQWLELERRNSNSKTLGIVIMMKIDPLMYPGLIQSVLIFYYMTWFIIRVTGWLTGRRKHCTQGGRGGQQTKKLGSAALWLLTFPG